MHGNMNIKNLGFVTTRSSHTPALSFAAIFSEIRTVQVRKSEAKKNYSFI